VDSTGQFARITTFMRDESGDKIAKIEAEIAKKLLKFSQKPVQSNHYGQSTRFPERNRILAQQFTFVTSFCLLLTALLIAFMFRSFKMVLVSIIPNLLPLMLTAGIMGFLDIPLKPSTILVFGIAFGLSDDDTVRFLSQYREELKKTTENANLFMQHLQMPA
jgi:predicted RND superfamily exporter protein